VGRRKETLSKKCPAVIFRDATEPGTSGSTLKAPRALMLPLAAAVDHDVSGLQLDAAPQRRLIKVRRKRKQRARTVQRKHR
jgi:hypothetical protein